MAEEKKTLLSGIQPSGELHIGNYFGMMKQLTELQEEYKVFAVVVDYHAMTTIHDGKTLAENTINVAIDYLATGIDPEKTLLYLQSDVPEVTELAWIFNTLVTVPYLSRAVVYKDKIAQGIPASAGLLTYPVLQAADILIMDADVRTRLRESPWASSPNRLRSSLLCGSSLLPSPSLGWGPALQQFD